ncbi:MAG: nuclear transport factor 2 family protein [Nitrospiria bacterium]
MKPLALAQQFMDIFFSEDNPEQLKPLLSGDFTFQGPFYTFDSPEDYIEALRSNPPQGMQYRIIRAYESESSACLIYRFIKPGVGTPMAQVFEVRDGRICKILLLFDTRPFNIEESL